MNRRRAVRAMAAALAANMHGSGGPLVVRFSGRPCVNCGRRLDETSYGNACRECYERAEARRRRNAGDENLPSSGGDN